MILCHMSAPPAPSLPAAEVPFFFFALFYILQMIIVSLLYLKQLFIGTLYRDMHVCLDVVSCLTTTGHAVRIAAHLRTNQRAKQT